MVKTEMGTGLDNYYGVERVTEMFLHGNKIARRAANIVVISNCGYATTVTKERLNGILDYLEKSRIFQHDWNWYWDNEVFPSNKFVQIK